MDKEKILKDSVKRLLELNISDKEIIENLKSVGVEESTAKRILAETKGNPHAPSAKNEDESEEDIYSKVYDELEQEDALKTPVSEKPIRNPSYSGGSGNGDMAKLWEKGILATVDSKLVEMQKLKNEIDSIIDEKVKRKVEFETRKIDTLLESQRTLFNTKIDSHLESKAEEIKKVVESRATNLEDIHAKVQTELAKVQSEKTFNQELLNSIDEKLSALESVKSQMISETNASRMKAESEFAEQISEFTKKRDEMEARVNRALQLESKITEGLIEDAKQKIDAMKLDKESELTERVQEKLQEFEEMAQKVDPQGINDMISRLRELEKQLVARQKEIDRHIDAKFAENGRAFDAFKKEVSRIEASNLAELRKEYAANVDDLFAKSLEAWDKKLKKKEGEVDAALQKIDLEKFNATMESLDLFKQQFVNTITKSIQDYNKSKKELSQSIMARDKAINEYLKKIDLKMQELNDFEKRFAASVSDIIDKIPDSTPQKTAKTPAKKKSKA